MKAKLLTYVPSQEYKKECKEINCIYMDLLSALLIIEDGPLQVDCHLCVLSRHVEQELGGAPAARRLHVLSVHLDDVEELLETRPERRVKKIALKVFKGQKLSLIP